MESGRVGAPTTSSRRTSCARRCAQSLVTSISHHHPPPSLTRSAARCPTALRDALQRSAASRAPLCGPALRRPAARRPAALRGVHATLRGLPRRRAPRIGLVARPAGSTAHGVERAARARLVRRLVHGVGGGERGAARVRRARPPALRLHNPCAQLRVTCRRCAGCDVAVTRCSSPVRVGLAVQLQAAAREASRRHAMCCCRGVRVAA